MARKRKETTETNEQYIKNNVTVYRAKNSVDGEIYEAETLNDLSEGLSLNYNCVVNRLNTNKKVAGFKIYSIIRESEEN